MISWWIQSQALSFLRNYILGDNPTGTVSGTTVIDDQHSTAYNNNLIPGGNAIFTGSGSTQGSFVYPTKTIEAWDSFTATALGPTAN